MYQLTSQQLKDLGYGYLPPQPEDPFRIIRSLYFDQTCDRVEIKNEPYANTETSCVFMVPDSITKAIPFVEFWQDVDNQGQPYSCDPIPDGQPGDEDKCQINETAKITVYVNGEQVAGKGIEDGIEKFVNKINKLKELAVKAGDIIKIVVAKTPWGKDNPGPGSLDVQPGVKLEYTSTETPGPSVTPTPSETPSTPTVTATATSTETPPGSPTPTTTGTQPTPTETGTPTATTTKTPEVTPPRRTATPTVYTPVPVGTPGGRGALLNQQRFFKKHPEMLPAGAVAGGTVSALALFELRQRKIRQQTLKNHRSTKKAITYQNNNPGRF